MGVEIGSAHHALLRLRHATKPRDIRLRTARAKVDGSGMAARAKCASVGFTWLIKRFSPKIGSIPAKSPPSPSGLAIWQVIQVVARRAIPIASQVLPVRASEDVDWNLSAACHRNVVRVHLSFDIIDGVTLHARGPEIGGLAAQFCNVSVPVFSSPMNSAIRHMVRPHLRSTCGRTKARRKGGHCTAPGHAFNPATHS